MSMSSSNLDWGELLSGTQSTAQGRYAAGSVSVTDHQNPDTNRIVKQNWPRVKRPRYIVIRDVAVWPHGTT